MPTVGFPANEMFCVDAEADCSVATAACPLGTMPFCQLAESVNDPPVVEVQLCTTKSLAGVIETLSNCANTPLSVVVGAEAVTPWTSSDRSLLQPRMFSSLTMK